METQTKNFSECSIQLTKLLTKTEKKKDGIFFTPQSITNNLLQRLSSLIPIHQELCVLEPSCGSGEFINAVLNSGLLIKEITGVEWNKKIYQHISKLDIPKTKIIHNDFLKTNLKSNLIIGNPPYFVMKKEQVPSQYLKFIEGRPNIFVIFILHALETLLENGLIAFIIPSSFLNSKYYERTRKYISENFTIHDIILYDEKNDFMETEQSTIGIIIQKKKDTNHSNQKFTLKISNQIMFFDSNTKCKLDKLLLGTTTIKDLGLTVKTGPIVWNQNKDKLVDSVTGSSGTTTVTSSGTSRSGTGTEQNAKI
jgi:adenine-specific DNA-methyltransferase